MAKSPRLDLFEKLSELKAWQSKQQEKLLAQQMDQENMLRRQQKQEMDLFGSRKTEVITSQNLATVRVQSDKQNLRDRDEIATRNQVVERNVEDDDTGNILGNVSLDDIPVKTLNLRFEELLEEKLKDVQNNPRERNEVKPKRHFLKKGEGLKRFRMKSPNEFLKANASNGPQKCSKKCNSKETSSTQNRNTANFRASNSKSKAAEVMPVKDQRAVGLNTQPPAKGSESTTWSHMLHQEQQRCPTKMEGIRKGEAEDLKVFELLEQMAVDSSFCSTSSTLLGFMESPIISTPLKAILEHRRELKLTVPSQAQTQRMLVSEQHQPSLEIFLAERVGMLAENGSTGSSWHQPF